MDPACITAPAGGDIMADTDHRTTDLHHHIDHQVIDHLVIARPADHREAVQDQLNCRQEDSQWKAKQLE